MSDHAEMLELVLDLMEGGVAILDGQFNVVYWNKAAATLTGYDAEDVLCRRCPDDLYRVDEEHRGVMVASSEAHRPCEQMRATVAGPATAENYHQSPVLEAETENGGNDESFELPTLVSISHKLGHSVPGMLRKAPLRNICGTRIGCALLFYPVE